METSKAKFAALLERAGELFRKGSYLEASSLLWAELIEQSDHLQGWMILGDLELELGRSEFAVRASRMAQKLAPNDPKVLFVLAAALRAEGEIAEAAKHLEEVTKALPQSAAAWSNLGNVQSDLGCLSEAEKSYRKAIDINPSFVAAQVNLGLVLISRGQLQEAETAFTQALENDPQSVPALLNLGGLALNAGQKEIAFEQFSKALEIDPESNAALYNQGCVLGQLGRFGEAKAALERVLARDPDDRDALAQFYHILQKTCAWDPLEKVVIDLDRQTSEALARGERPGETPFMSIARSADPKRNLRVAEAWSAEMVSRLAPMQGDYDFRQPNKRGERLKIGYLSGNFYDHPTAHNTAGLLAGHDRERFEIYAYSFGPNDQSSHRRFVEEHCDVFVDIAGLGDGEAARRINEDGIHILIALTGHTDGSRLEICALLPAPVQVGYLTFPGSCGGGFLDYILVDERVCPPGEASFYSEAPAYLPGTYWPTNDRQDIATPPSRKSQGLPESGFIFSCFNQTYKIDREVFACWMSLLRQVPDSFLWLFRSNSEAEANLKREAKAAGIDPARLVFADKLSKPKHLARISLADLGLDTQVYTGHTTTADALWAGVPVVALEGSHFASRVSASLLAALGLEDLITPNLQAYEALALHLAQTPSRLLEIKSRIKANRATKAMFDTKGKVADLEALFQVMWKRHCQGLPAAPLKGASIG